jgi:hypothetical protein
MVGINAGYIFEQVLGFSASAICLVLCLLQFCYGWYLDHNKSKVQALQKYLLVDLFTVGCLGAAWSVDPRGVWGIYSPMSTAMFRDWILIVLLVGFLFWSDLIMRSIARFVEVLKIYTRAPKWITTGWPVFILSILSLYCNIVGARTNRFLYRLMLMAAFAVVLTIYTIFTACCHRYLFKIIRNAERDISEISKLTRSRNMAIAVTSFCIFSLLMNVVLVNQGYTFSDALTYKQGKGYTPNAPLFIQILSGAVMFQICWVPLRNPAISQSQGQMQGNVQVGTTLTQQNSEPNPSLPTNSI